MSIYFMRVFVVADSIEVAEAYAYQYKELFHDFCQLTTMYIQPYWKIEEYYELFFECELDQKSLEHVRGGIGTERSDYRTGEAIWAGNCGATFTIEGTAWVHLQPEDV